MYDMFVGGVSAANEPARVTAQRELAEARHCHALPGGFYCFVDSNTGVAANAVTATFIIIIIIINCSTN